MNAPELVMLKSWLLAYLVNSLWQVPLVFLAATAAARFTRRYSPRLAHRIWVVALLLGTSLPACTLHLRDLSQSLVGCFSWMSGRGANHGDVRVLLERVDVSQAAGLQLPMHLLDALLLTYACALLYFTGRLAWGLWNTHELRRNAQCVMLTGEAAGIWARCVRRFGSDHAQPAVSQWIAGPVTIGVRRRMLLLPPNFLETVGGRDLDAVFAHEFAHMRRQDFAKNLLYGLLSLPVAYHPLLWMMRARVTETREIVCDAIAAEAVAGRKPYAQSLLRLASMLSEATRAPALHAIGIFYHVDSNTLERRVMTLTHTTKEIAGARRLLIAAACAAVALATCASALALRVDVGAPPTSTQTRTPSKIAIAAGIMASNKISGLNPTYPAAAKAKKIQGTVVLEATIDQNGIPQYLRVKTSPAQVLSNSSIEAVRTWRYRPYLLNGEPVAVETTINIMYNLGK